MGGSVSTLLIEVMCASICHNEVNKELVVGIQAIMVIEMAKIIQLKSIRSVVRTIDLREIFGSIRLALSNTLELDNVCIPKRLNPQEERSTFANL